MTEHDPLTVDEDKAKRAKVVNRYEERKINDVRRIVNTSEGRRFLWRVLIEAKMHHSCFDTNALTMAMNEGRRDIGLFITNEILKANPGAIEEMRSEAASDRLIQDAELNKTEKGDSNG